MGVSEDRILNLLLYRIKSTTDVHDMNITVCGTTYNELDKIPSFISSLKFINPREVIITDSLSTDGTDVKMREMNVSVISESCTRGKGRNLAARSSSTEYIMMADIDNVYDLSGIDFAKLSKDRIHVFFDTIHHNAWIAFGRRELFIRHPFRDLDVAEDVYFYLDAPVRFHYRRFAFDLNFNSRESRLMFPRIRDTIIGMMFHRSNGATLSEIFRVALRKYPPFIPLFFPYALAVTLLGRNR